MYQKQFEGLLREPFVASYDDTTGAIVEWHDGAHTHMGLEVLDVHGHWVTLATVALTDCRVPGMRERLRQFPMFRLAWYGQVGEPSNCPQRLMPEQVNLVSSVDTTLS
jgi:hypothetical protein